MTIRRLKAKRIYEPATADDGCRILIDRLWPRGVKKEVAKIDLWAKSITPSSELRKWFHEDRSREAEFRKRYEAELDNAQQAMIEVVDQCQSETMTLISAVKELGQGHVPVLESQLRRLLSL